MGYDLGDALVDAAAARRIRRRFRTLEQQLAAQRAYNAELSRALLSQPGSQWAKNATAGWRIDPASREVR
jgi:hypothetical protein